MSEYVPTILAHELAPGCVRCVEVLGRPIALYNLEGEFFATDDLCTHAEASLSEGQIQGDEIVCPLHFATFNIRSGACTGPPASDDLRTYPVRVSPSGLIEVAVKGGDRSG